MSHKEPRITRRVTMADVQTLEDAGLHELAKIAAAYAVDRPRWWHRFTRRNSKSLP